MRHFIPVPVRCFVLAVLLLTFWDTANPAVAQAADAPEPLAALEQRVPRRADGFDDATAAAIVSLSATVERDAFTRSRIPADVTVEQLLAIVRRLLDVQQQVDATSSRLLELRTGFVALPDTPQRQQQVRNFLRSAAVVADLSGRIRYLMFDVLKDVASELSDDEEDVQQLVSMLTEAHSSVGAAVMAPLLFDATEANEKAPPPSAALRMRVLALIAASRQYALDAELARFIRQPGLPPQLVMAAAETLRIIGLPQTPRPGSDPSLPKPAITADEVLRIVQKVDASQLTGPLGHHYATLVAWLDTRRRQGVVDEAYRLGRIEVRPGDWLLMRNPSPYNRFTDLSPGLYTHVGVVTAETGSDGIRRFLVIDLPERGNSIPATTIDTFVKRTLNYTVIRENDRDVAARMGRTAAEVIGNPSRFDLRFRTEGIEQLKGQKLRGAIVQGYCAGLLLLCAQETGQPRSHFFPLSEHPAGGNTLANLGKLGISMGQDFLSPTGPLFSPQMTVLGGRDPLYDPRRQIEEAVYDHFAWNMANRQLVPSPDAYQSMRQSLAEASKGNPLLAKALANAAGVNENMDLVAAAKLGAVVESLDQIAYGASREFAAARDAILNSEPGDTRRIRLRVPRLQQARVQQARSQQARSQQARSQQARSQQARVQQPRAQQQASSPYLQRHAELSRLWNAESLTPRQLREQLVEFYIAAGKQQLDNRFFRSTGQ